MCIRDRTWLLLDVAMVVALWPFIVGRRGTRAYRLAQTALVLIVAAAVVAALSASPTFGGPRLLPAGKGSPTSLLHLGLFYGCLLYTSDAADERSSVDLGGPRIIKKKKNVNHTCGSSHHNTINISCIETCD